MNASIFKKIFMTISIFEIFCEIIRANSGSMIGIYLFKPLLMPALMLFFYHSIPNKNHILSKLMLGALFFSFLGDVFLMLPYDLFILGLASFLVTHLLYAYSFFAECQKFSQTKITVALTRFMILLFPAAILFAEMQKKLGDLIVPVTVYVLVIEIMGLFAWLRREYQSLNSYVNTFLGAILFIISDSTIAINKFISPFGAASLFIMATYIAGQYFIIYGFAKSSVYEKN